MAQGSWKCEAFLICIVSGFVILRILIKQYCLQSSAENKTFHLMELVKDCKADCFHETQSALITFYNFINKMLVRL